MSIYHTAQAIEASALGQTIRESTWLFPAIEATHLLALALLGGSVLIIALLITGILLGVSEPVKLYGRQAFWVKMISLAIALVITYFAFNPAVARGGRGVGVRTITGLTLAAWLMVAMAGRWIGFS